MGGTRFLEEIYPLGGIAEDYHRIIEHMGNVQLVLIGEASHGTQEFYAIRAALTRHLIQEHGFDFVAIEADWPDTYQINHYSVEGKRDWKEALAGFKRFPTWMWRNQEIVKFIQWLHSYNNDLSPSARDIKHKVSIYGLDLYSLHTSIDIILHTLDNIDPHAASRARQRYSCLDQYGEDPQDYAYAVGLGLSEGCAQEIYEQLCELQNNFRARLGETDLETRESIFNMLQNAKAVKDAEAYYRSLLEGDISSWNLRDKHMMEMLESLLAYHDNLLNKPCKAIVWAHNSHVGDARATQRNRVGELNIGQLVKEKYGNKSYTLGFSTAVGTVTAASSWGGTAECKEIRQPLPDSYEHLLSQVEHPAFFLPFHYCGKRIETPLTELLMKPHLHRAIGVLYKPETERCSHYFYSVLPQQYDGIIHIYQTHALAPLDNREKWPTGDMPEAFPSGL